MYDPEKFSKVYQIAKVHGTLNCFWGLQKLDVDVPTHAELWPDTNIHYQKNFIDL